LLQTAPLARWHDNSVKWLLLDFLVGPLSAGEAIWTLAQDEKKRSHPEADRLHVIETPEGIAVDTGVATFCLDRKIFRPFLQVVVRDRKLLDNRAAQTLLQDASGRTSPPRIKRIVLEEVGHVRATLRFEGRFTGKVRCRFVARLCFFAGTGMVRLRLTIHNPNRAGHPGGLWDLGDGGSMLFRDLSLELALQEPDPLRTSWVAETDQQPRHSLSGNLEIYQDSSGGQNWQSANHLNRDGRVPCTFRGYRVRNGNSEEHGLRASPVVSIEGRNGRASLAFPEFWQQFPKALEADGPVLRGRFFPGQFDDLFELQGGEQKTHTLWFQFDTGEQPRTLPLEWVHRPARVHASGEWYAASAAISPFVPISGEEGGRLDSLLGEAMSGERSLLARREIIDEYGWRDFGEIYADHEEAYYTGQRPVISHYNNQYDSVFGSLLQYFRTGDSAWLKLCDPLARHVIDIDIYHTDRDKAAYNGGLFWFTDHYKTAGTCTHRTYSRTNCRPGDRSYGGGPSSAHNFTTGLLHYYYLTGDPNARDAVLSLANWVVNMDDGRQNILGLVDDGPTGQASCTFHLDYQGPGRGCGNSVNALLDAWLLTGSRAYLTKAESLIRRCVHPGDNIEKRDLLNVELRWSYPVFFSSLARYLRVKAESQELDFMYAYGQESLLKYAQWMLENEVPYFDHPEKLEYPTETWAAQELRKANILRLAAAHADEPLGTRLAQRGDELADRAWSDLFDFESRTAARAVAIVMVEGLQDLAFRHDGVGKAPRAALPSDFGPAERFIPQKLRVLAQLKTMRGAGTALLRLTNPVNWLRHLFRASGTLLAESQKVTPQSFSN
jgi:hypothetical protein